MNWITTNLRLPENLYMELKMKAAKERKSIAAVIREKLSEDTQQEKTSNVLKMMENLGEKIAKDHRGLNLTKRLIDVRYEQ